MPPKKAPQVAVTAREKNYALIENIVSLSIGLPPSVPIATTEDRIYHVMQNVSGDDAWQTFNRRFDILFGEDCRDVDGRMHHIRQGPSHGMGAVCAYLKSIDLSNTSLLHDLMEIKLTRLAEEIVYLLSNTSTHIAVAGASEPSSSATITSTTLRKIVLTVPAQSVISKSVTKSVKTSAKDAEDKDYVPRNPRSLSESPIPEFALDDDGLEIISDTTPKRSNGVSSHPRFAD
ncbi:hypothetical protein BJ138DRAFT_1119065 [Hygrophoropsis aurantiaca]|uniref:Uncharacterized protein n=1 Tax=Hygrophoropsis aurantiaca TaxID=72124 RepID=A0ACB7ZVW8_9AGAM|nr:hypothetical protein BJ138DRAFT_1119065 [Hygrophoropsis aurantiaca]